MRPARCRFALPALVFSLAIAAPAAAAPPAADTWLDALEQGTPSLQFRLRYEFVGDDLPAASAADAHATTLRSTLGYRTASYQRVSAYAEFENVAAVGGDHLYDNRGAAALWNGVTGRPGVADPAITAVSQAYAAFHANDATEFRAGRIPLAFDNQRWVGPVGWRQHQQTFDGASLTNASLARTTFTYAWVARVNRIFGDQHRTNAHLVNVGVAPDARVSVAGYYYHLDYRDGALEGLSTGTIGARAHGAVPLGDLELPFDVEVARQSDVSDNPVEVSAGLYRVQFGVAGDLGETNTRGAFKVGQEVLGGTPAEGRLTTPLATLHGFNGWADRFLATPPHGLRDFYVDVSVQPGAFTFQFVHHWFRADGTDARYGRELDLLATWKSPAGPLVGAKGAVYREDGFSFDARKFWLWVQLAVR